jgi:hypothetical protein
VLILIACLAACSELAVPSAPPVFERIATGAEQSRLAKIQQSIADGDAEAAIGQLDNLRRHVDGCGSTADENDWIVDCAAQLSVRDLIDTMITGLGG